MACSSLPIGSCGQSCPLHRSPKPHPQPCLPPPHLGLLSALASALASPSPLTTRHASLDIRRAALSPLLLLNPHPHCHPHPHPLPPPRVADPHLHPLPHPHPHPLPRLWIACGSAPARAARHAPRHVAPTHLHTSGCAPPSDLRRSPHGATDTSCTHACVPMRMHAYAQRLSSHPCHRARARAPQLLNYSGTF